MRLVSWFPLAVLVGWIGAGMADGTTASSASAAIVAVVDIEEVIHVIVYLRLEGCP